MNDNSMQSPYRTISKEALLALLKNHVLFLKKQPKGSCASLKFFDLGGQDFHGLNLSKIDFSGARLDEANLQDCDLTQAIFFCANLQNANLKNAISYDIEILIMRF